MCVSLSRHHHENSMFFFPDSPRQMDVAIGRMAVTIAYQIFFSNSPHQTQTAVNIADQIFFLIHHIRQSLVGQSFWTLRECPTGQSTPIFSCNN